MRKLNFQRGFSFTCAKLLKALELARIFLPISIKNNLCGSTNFIHDVFNRIFSRLLQGCNSNLWENFFQKNLALKLWKQIKFLKSCQQPFQFIFIILNPSAHWRVKSPPSLHFYLVFPCIINWKFIK